jgi:hypothetical protein
MRLNALCLIGALAILMMPLSARAVPAQAERQTAHAQTSRDGGLYLPARLLLGAGRLCLVRQI